MVNSKDTIRELRKQMSVDRVIGLAEAIAVAKKARGRQNLEVLDDSVTGEQMVASLDTMERLGLFGVFGVGREEVEKKLSMD